MATNEKFSTGAVRSNDTAGQRWDLIPWRTVLGIVQAANTEKEHLCCEGLFAIHDAVESDLQEIVPIAIWAKAWLELGPVSEAFHEGAVKYSPNNYKKGFPAYVFLNHAARHFWFYFSGDRSEDHLGHGMWNLLVFLEQAERMPELLTLAEANPVQTQYPDSPEFSKEFPSDARSLFEDAWKAFEKDGRESFSDFIFMTTTYGSLRKLAKEVEEIAIERSLDADAEFVIFLLKTCPEFYKERLQSALNDVEQLYNSYKVEDGAVSFWRFCSRETENSEVNHCADSLIRTYGESAFPYGQQKVELIAEIKEYFFVEEEDPSERSENG